MVGKNYRLQDIQLSKSSHRGLVAEVRDGAAGLPDADPRMLFPVPDPPLARTRVRMVENTGLEPVTSCLQSRRSPS